MADIKPLRAWRYNQFLTENLKTLTAPLSESVLKQRKEAFYKAPFHYFHISSPVDVPPFENVARRVENWKLDNVIQPDPMLAFYVYEQQYARWGQDELFRRVGIIAHIEAQPFSEEIILPHEMTIAKAVAYRTSLLEYTRMHTVPTHGFYTDADCLLEAFMEESLLNPLYQLEDSQGTKHTLSAIQDLKAIQKCIEVLREKQVWIADGHHRYESSVAYKARQKAQNPNHTGQEAYNYHLMWLTNTESSDLGILPTHRMIHSLAEFNPEVFLEAIQEYFHVEPCAFEDDWGLAPSENLWTFTLLFAEEAYLIRLRPEVFAQFDAPLPEAVKALDLSVLHYFILEKVLGLKEQEQFEYLDFSQYISQCVHRVKSGKAQAAILTRRITLKEIQAVCLSGHIMPAKSTYFFPKVLGGFLFSSVES